jgi:haloalkane dehalogenase
MVLQKNVFVERILPASVLRGLGDEEMQRYRTPYREAGESRRPTLTWPREIPIDGEPADVVAIVRDYGEWLATTSRLPKLFVNAEPGSILVGAQREFCRRWPNSRSHGRGEPLHPGRLPDEIGRALSAFVRRT